MKKRLLRSAPVCILLLALLLSFAPVHAAEQYSAVLELGCSPAFPARMTVWGRTLALEGIPDSEDYRYILLYLNRPGGGAEVYRETVERDGWGSASFTLSNVPAGRYSIEIYHAGEQNLTYVSAVHGDDIQIRWNGDGGEFILSPIYAHNSAVSRSKREDLAALTYYLEPSDEIQSNDPAIRTLAAQITAGLTDSYDKAAALHDWVCSNIYYDYDVSGKRTARSDPSAAETLRSRRGVCAGYANLLTALLRAAGIPAKRILGYALGYTDDGAWPSGFDPKTSYNHAWTEAYADSRWIIIDATWDSSNAWEHGGITDDSGLRGHHYFDISPALFAADHSFPDYSEADIGRYVNSRKITATAFSGRVTVNGVFGLNTALYTIGGSNYIKLRDAAAMLRGVGRDVNVGWDGETATITIVSGEPYVFQGGELSGPSSAKSATAALPSVKVTLDGEKLFLNAYTIGSSTYFRLRDLGQLLGFGVGYDEKTRTINIDLLGAIF